MTTFSQQQGIPVMLGSGLVGTGPVALDLDDSYDHFITKITLGAYGTPGVVAVYFYSTAGDFLWSGALDTSAEKLPPAYEGGQGIVLQGESAPYFVTYADDARFAVFGYRLAPTASSIFS